LRKKSTALRRDSRRLPPMAGRRGRGGRGEVCVALREPGSPALSPARPPSCAATLDAACSDPRRSLPANAKQRARARPPRVPPPPLFAPRPATPPPP
jgi:hypothetical protein